MKVITDGYGHDQSIAQYMARKLEAEWNNGQIEDLVKSTGNIRASFGKMVELLYTSNIISEQMLREMLDMRDDEKLITVKNRKKVG